MSRLRIVAVMLARTLPARLASRMIRWALRRYEGLEYEPIALNRALGFFALAEPITITTLRNGRRIQILNSDHVSRILYFMGDFQPRLSWVISKLLDAGDSVIDIGANIGWFTVTAANCIGPNGIVHAFEPQPQLALFLRTTIVENGFRNVFVHEVALSERNEKMTLRVLDGNTGAATLGRAEEDSSHGSWNAIEISARNAEDALEALKLDRIRMIKIDVEGHEATVLRAARRFLELHPPDIILFESHVEDGVFRSRAIVQILLSLGYRIFQFDMDSRRSVKLSPAPLDGHGSNSQVDFVALHQGPRITEDMARLNIG